MIDRETLTILTERAKKDELGREEIITVLSEYKEALDLLDLAASEGFRTPIQKELDTFLGNHQR